MYKFRDWIKYGGKIEISRSSERSEEHSEIEILRSSENSKELRKIDWNAISRQRSDAAIQLIEQNFDKIDWDWNILSANPAATHILEKNRDKVNWYYLAHNPRAFHLFHQMYEEEIKSPPPPTKEEIEEYEDETNREIIEDIMMRVINDIVFDSDERDNEAIYGNETPTPEEMERAVSELYGDDHDIYWRALSENDVFDEAIDILEKNPDKISWKHLSSNCSPRAIRLLEQNPDKIVWSKLCYNSSPEAIRFLEKYPEKIVWSSFLQNCAVAENAIHLFEEHIEKIDWNGQISYFTGDRAIQFIENHLDKVNWNALTTNSRAFHILEKNPNKIWWPNLSMNRNPGAIRLLEQNPDKINWWVLSSNPAAIELIERNLDKVNWTTIWSNPAIFVYDYPRMRSSRLALHEELISCVFHPSRVLAFLENGGDLDEGIYAAY